MRGGSPPRDNIISGVSAATVGDFDQDDESILIEVHLFNLKRLKAENVIKIYVNNVISVMEGENCKTIIIQPR